MDQAELLGPCRFRRRFWRRFRRRFRRQSRRRLRRRLPRRIRRRFRRGIGVDFGADFGAEFGVDFGTDFGVEFDVEYMNILSTQPTKYSEASLCNKEKGRRSRKDTLASKHALWGGALFLKSQYMLTRHPRSYPLVRASFRQIFVFFRRFSKFSDMFGSIRMHPDALRCIKRQSCIFRNFRNFVVFFYLVEMFFKRGGLLLLRFER